MFTHRPHLASFALYLALLPAAGCTSKPKPEMEPSTPDPVAAAPAVPIAAAPAAEPVLDAAHQEAKEIFASRCAACHGATGRGDGPVAAALNPKPRNYSDKAWQAEVSDATITKVIVSGGPSIGKSAIMPPNPDLADKPKTLAALCSLIRSYGG